MHTSEMPNGYRSLVHNGSVIARESTFASGKPGDAVKPGDRLLWVSALLNRDEVDELCAILQHWLDEGRLPEIKEGE